MLLLYSEKVYYAHIYKRFFYLFMFAQTLKMSPSIDTFAL